MKSQEWERRGEKREKPRDGQQSGNKSDARAQKEHRRAEIHRFRHLNVFVFVILWSYEVKYVPVKVVTHFIFVKATTTRSF